MSEYDHYQLRTAGQGSNPVKSVQAWKTSKGANIAHKQENSVTEKNILSGLEKASRGRVGHFDMDLRTASAYAPDNHEASLSNKSSDQYALSDVVDIVNPLHHLPLVSMVYRNVTGDDIHPMSQIIGGALYGGPVGAVTGTANAISKVQTGKNIGDHLFEASGLKNVRKSQNADFKNGIHKEEVEFFDSHVAKQKNIKKTIEAYEQTLAFAAIERNNSQTNLSPLSAVQTSDPVTNLTLSKMPPRKET